uniref:Uncharacterized protein n=1 Tax=Mimiviridae sp. ChoanoV1 TaxID=2596887 RepID=A0A5B8IEY7_9VIRU|nr:hypothetical protein 1_293 [Mimiviridae sp. ChoanoV1]
MNINDEGGDVFYNDWNVINDEELDNEIAEINILYDEMMKNENILEQEKVLQYIEIEKDKDGNKDSFDEIDLNNEIIEPNLEVIEPNIKVIEPQNIITDNDIIVPEPIYETNILRNRNVNYNKIFDDSIQYQIMNKTNEKNKQIIINHKKLKSTYLTKMGFLGILLSVNLMVYIIYTNEISNRKMITY